MTCPGVWPQVEGCSCNKRMIVVLSSKLPDAHTLSCHDEMMTLTIETVATLGPEALA